MLALQGIIIIALLENVVAIQQTFKAGDVEFSSCAEAREYASSRDIPTTVECHSVERYVPDDETPVSGEQQIAAEPGVPLSRYKVAAEFVLADRDASGVTFLNDELLLITYQDWLEFRSIDGEVRGNIGPVDGDIEGLEYQDGRLVAVDERGSTHIDLNLAGTDITVANEKALQERGIECVAHDPLKNTFYYGVESSGDLVNENIESQINLTRDLSACTVHRGEIMAITSHPWRQSIWYRIDMDSWRIIDRKPLPDGDWEGIACINDTCALVRESSEKSTAGLTIFEARPRSSR